MRYLMTRIGQENGKYLVEFKVNTWSEDMWRPADFERFDTEREALDHEVELWDETRENEEGEEE